MNYAGDIGISGTLSPLAKIALESAAVWGVRFTREAAAREVTVSAGLWRNMGLALRLLGRKKAALGAWAEYLIAVDRSGANTERDAAVSVVDVLCKDFKRDDAE